ncbi:MAG TPA: undecaprenyldiphospho-muramoylpentapeptide beta-N-acetylglucosaminyltransferase [Longimicrobiaceae bacterium]|nr:undecaprenyldiphospho-muramoylpentapeptide beta-N-acetylglucosaminyltransferase [Longimicrobiaceae bacterium]
MTGPRVLFAGGGTGGHLYPALALADAFARLDSSVEVMFIGARRGIEARVLPERAVRHVLLPFEPIRRSRPWQNWRLGPAMLGSVRGLAAAFKDFRPHLVVGTGGYASGPTVGWGILKGVPTALQEQNSFPGLTTRWLASRTRQIHLAFPEAREYLKPGRTTEVFVYGNPIRPPDRSLSRSATREQFGLGDGLVTLVVGGSQGARAVNEALIGELRALSEGKVPARPGGLEILWATGPAHHESIAARVRQLGFGSWVHTTPYIQDMAAALAAADIAISRAGAMALAELCAWEIPSILIPLPTAAANHQYHNAAALADAGAAVLIQEQELVEGRLWAELTALGGDPERRAYLSTRAGQRGNPDAADEIVTALAELIPSLSSPGIR